MATPKIRIRGERKLRRAFKQLSEGTRKAIAADIRRRITAIKRDAQQAAPTDTGLLRRTLRRRTLKGGMVGVVFDEQEYARFVEFPTERTEAQPFLLPAFKEHTQDFHHGIRRIIGNEARKVSI